MDNDELDLLFGNKKISTKDLFTNMSNYVKPEISKLIFCVVLALFNVLTNVVLPLIMSNITNEIKGLNPIFATILFLVIGYFLIILVGQTITYFQSMILTKAGQRIIYNLRMDVFSHIQSMSLNQFDKMPVGSLVTRVASYTENVSNLFTDVLIMIIQNTLTIVAVFFVMFGLSFKLSLIILPLFIILFFVTLYFRRYISKLYKEEKACYSDLNSFLSENISGMKITQLFNKEDRKLDEFDIRNNNINKVAFNIVKAFGFYRPGIQYLYYLAVALVFYFGVTSKLNAGEIVAFYLLLDRFFHPIQNLADQLNNIQKATSACERLFNLMSVEPQILDKKDAIEVEKFEGKIEFKNVWFAYKKDEWILKDVSFKIEPKQTAAFVGATGAGKTTILGLIVRNFEIQKGQILIDDIDISHIKIESLRKAIGQMLQDVFLFSGSIKENITLHDEKYCEKDVKEACDYVHADYFIDKLENGLDEEVIERGENYSSGERQLLSFARTVLTKPQILILDEATANIDTETEFIIQKSLKKLSNIGTMLVVAHRLSTIQHADVIFVLQDGKIIERGTHQDLLKNRGHYHKLYMLQFENK